MTDCSFARREGKTRDDSPKFPYLVCLCWRVVALNIVASRHFRRFSTSVLFRRSRILPRLKEQSRLLRLEERSTWQEGVLAIHLPCNQWYFIQGDWQIAAPFLGNAALCITEKVCRLGHRR